MNEIKKSFDPTVCFMFFGSWLKVLEGLETEQDKSSVSYTLFKAIAEYSMYDIEPDFSEQPTLKAIWIMFEKEIDLSVTRRKRGFAQDEMNEKYQTIITAITHNPDASLRAIADLTHTTKDMVDRVKKKYHKEIEEAIENASRSSVGVEVASNTVVNSKAIYVDDISDSYSVRQDTDETMRQTSYTYDDEDLPF